MTATCAAAEMTVAQCDEVAAVVRASRELRHALDELETRLLGEPAAPLRVLIEQYPPTLIAIGRFKMSVKSVLPPTSHQP